LPFAAEFKAPLALYRRGFFFVAMTEARKNLYRKLLYVAMLEMRMHSSWPSRLFYSWNWNGRSRRSVLQFINNLTDWLHNLALYSSLDFEGFEEELFWQDCQAFREQFPADKWVPFLEGMINQFKK
jgi:hypothetical protein